MGLILWAKKQNTRQFPLRKIKKFYTFYSGCQARRAKFPFLTRSPPRHGYLSTQQQEKDPISKRSVRQNRPKNDAIHLTVPLNIANAIGQPIPAFTLACYATIVKQGDSILPELSIRLPITATWHEFHTSDGRTSNRSSYPFELFRWSDGHREDRIDVSAARDRNGAYRP